MKDQNRNIENFDSSRRRFFKSAGATIVLTSTAATLLGCNSSSQDSPPTDDELDFDRPRATIASGRYSDSVIVHFEDVTENAEIRYTTDGFDPSLNDKLYNKDNGIVVSESTTILARTFLNGEESEVGVYTYQIKEKSLFTAVAISDTEIVSIQDSGFDNSWVSNFDVISAFSPNPDLIIGAGDLIRARDGRDDEDGWKHALLHEVWSYNLSRTGMHDTQVLLSRGNHDARVMHMVQGYPKDWFPIVQEDEAHGYYHKKVGNYHVIAYDSCLGNNSDAGIAQAEFVQATLEEIKDSNDYNGEPIIIHAHHPLPETVNGGRYAGGHTRIKAILNEHPEILHFSGHSHFPHTDERSIFQDKFTNLNCASTNYVWMDDSKTTSDYDTVETAQQYPTWSFLMVDFYEDRVEIERVALAADSYYGKKGGSPDVVRPTVNYDDNEISPLSFRSAGALCGKPWIYNHNSTSVDLEKFNQHRIDSIQATEMSFEHNLSLHLKEDKLRLEFDNIRNHTVPVYHFVIEFYETNISGVETQIFRHAYHAETIFAPTLQRFDIPVCEDRELYANTDYRVKIVPRDTTLGMHEECAVEIEFTAESIENGEYTIKSAR